MCEIHGQRASGTTNPDDVAEEFVVIGGMRVIHFTHITARQLIDCGLVTPYGDRDLGQHWLR